MALENGIVVASGLSIDPNPWTIIIWRQNQRIRTGFCQIYSKKNASDLMEFQSIQNILLTQQRTRLNIRSRILVSPEMKITHAREIIGPWYPRRLHRFEFLVWQ
jgi:hypothetical protein